MSASRRNLRIGIVAGEVSGDQLGAGLLQALQARGVSVDCEGIGGEHMIDRGCRSLYPIERLSVIGFTEALSRYRELAGIRRALYRRFCANPPDVFIGIDAPDFNLGLEKDLRRAGVRTMHYVSPTVWAWRGYRIRLIRQAVDHMLTLFPFEESYYRAQRVPVTFVGHPLADQIPDHVDAGVCRKALGLPLDAPVVALLPGSRGSELNHHAELFVRTAQWLHTRHPGVQFAVPFVNAALQQIFERAIVQCGAQGLSFTAVRGRSREVMGAADVVLLASGTATLEAALLKRAMVVTYKVPLLSQWLIRLLSQVKLYAMVNNLAGREVAPELMQENAVPEKLGQAVEEFLLHPEKVQEARDVFAAIHQQLRGGGSARAAEAVLALAGAGA